MSGTGQSWRSEDLAKTLVRSAVAVTLGEAAWKVFGFNGPPKRGAWFNRFVKEQTLAQETFLYREFTVLGIGVMLNGMADRVSKHLINRVAARAIDITVSGEGMVKAYRFSTYDQCVSHLVDGVCEYLTRDNRTLPDIFFDRAAAQVGDHIRGDWMVRAAVLLSPPDNPLLTVYSHLFADIPQEVEGEVRMRDDRIGELLRGKRATQGSQPDHERVGGTLAESINLKQLRGQYRGSRYADLIAHHLKQQSQEDRVAGVLGTTEWLPSPLGSEMEGFIDRWNTRVYEKEFWNSDAAVVMDEIMADAKDLAQSHGIEPDDETLFNVFNIVTLSFAYSAYDQPKMRAFMGISR